MNALEQAINQAYAAKGSTKQANKVYLEFIKANFFVPIEKQKEAETKPRVLFLQESLYTFLPVFTRRENLQQWASPIADEIDILHLSGVNLLKGLGDNIIVSLNIGLTDYKEFNAAELARMKNMVAKFFNS